MDKSWKNEKDSLTVKRDHPLFIICLFLSAGFFIHKNTKHRFLLVSPKIA